MARKVVVARNANTGVSQLSATTSQILNLLSAWETSVGATPRGITVGPISGHIQVSASAENPAVPGTTHRASFGICVLDADAVAASAFPDPASDFEFPWLWHFSGLFQVGTDTPNSYTYPLLPLAVIEVATGAQRKLQYANEGLYLLGENPTASGVHDPNAWASLRTSVRLP